MRNLVSSTSASHSIPPSPKAPHGFLALELNREAMPIFLAVYVHGCAEPERTSADYKEPVGERLVENPATNRATVLLDFTLINLGETLPPKSCYFRIDNNRFIVTCGKRRRISARMRAAGWQATARKLFRPHRRRWKQSTECFTVPVAD